MTRSLVARLRDDVGTTTADFDPFGIDVEAPAPDAQTATPTAPATGNGANASPVARRVAQTEGIDR